MRVRFSLAAILLAVGIVAPASALAVGFDDHRLGELYDITRVDDAAVRRAAKAVVFFGNATGFVVSPDGHVLTNHHVAQSFGSSGAVYIEYTAGGYRQRAWIDLVVASARYDMALYKARSVAGLPYIPIRATPARVGEAVFCVGHPNGRAQEASFGRVLAVGAVIAGRQSVEYSAQTWWGSSGSPICDRAGNAVALHWGWDAEGTSTGRLAGIPLDQAARAVPELGRVVQAYGTGATVRTGATATTGASSPGPGPSPSVGPSPSASTSTSTSLGSATGYLRSAGDVRYLRLPVPARGDLTVDLAGAKGADFDLAVWKWDAGTGRRTAVASADSSAASERVTVRGASAGTYIVVVLSHRGTGAFSVSATLRR